MVLHPADMRLNYALRGLDEADLHPDPIEQFKVWFEEAREGGVVEPNAMTLATASATGEPSARIVLLKGLDERGFVFYSNYESAKGRDLAANPRAALGFYWPQLERQVRIAGSVERVAQEESRAYFDSRPLGSRLAATLSRQSEVVPSREYLAAEYRQARGAVWRGAGAPSRLLGWLPGDAGIARILAGTPQPPPRPAALPPYGRGVDDRAAVALRCGRAYDRLALTGSDAKARPPLHAGR